MAEVEGGRTIQINGIDMQEIKTKAVEDDVALNNELLPTENSRHVVAIANEAAPNETNNAELIDVKEMEKRQLSPTQIENNEINVAETMERAVERIEAEDEFDLKEINNVRTEKGKLTQVLGEEAVEEQVVEDRTEDQVPDITGTDNADVMATSMDSIEELPTSEEQAIETSALTEQETELPVESETDKLQTALTAEAETLLEEEKIAVNLKVETRNEFNEIETILEEGTAPVEEATTVTVEALQKDNEAKEVPAEQKLDALEAKSEELESQELERTQTEAEQAEDELKYTKPVEVTDVIQEIVVEQSLATNESEAAIEEFSVEAEATNEEQMDIEGNKPDNVEPLNEKKQSKVWAIETVEMVVEGDQKEEENNFTSALQPNEKSEASQSDEHSSRTSISKFEEANDPDMTTPPMIKQQFTFDDEKLSSKKFVTEDNILERKRSTTEEKNSSRKTSTMGEEIPSRKVSTMEENVLSRTSSVIEDEKFLSRKASEVKEKKAPSRKTSAIQEAKVPSRKTSEIETESRKASAIEEVKVASRKSSATQEKPLSRKISLEIEEKVQSRKTSKMANLEENNETMEYSLEAPKSITAGRTKKAKTEEYERNVEPELEAVVESAPAAEEIEVEAGERETMVEIGSEEFKNEIPIEDAIAEDIENEMEKTRISYVSNDDQEYSVIDERESPPISRKIISSPTHRRSPSPIRKRQERSPSPVRKKTTYGSTYMSYDQDKHRQRGPPARMPSYLSFSSYTPVEKTTYSPISPWIQNTTRKYRNDYTAVSIYKPPSTYTTIFDDIVNSGPFSSSLYSTTRLLERSRSRSRELRNALRSKRSTSNYYRYTSSYATPPFRTRDYSTPPLSSVYHPSSRSGSFISFMEYSGQKQYELARSPSRFSAFDGLSRTSSRSNIDVFYDTERLSRVDSYVRDLNRHVEYGLPSAYAKYRSPARPYLTQEYTPINEYRAYPTTNSPSSTLSRLYSGFARYWTMGS
ncbi:hypothetical protein ACO02O_02659 [Dirofilaria immitis]